MGQLKLALQVPTVDLTQIPTQLVAKLLLHSRRGMISYHGKAPLQPLFSSQKVFPKSATVPVTSNLAARAWNIKCRRK